ELARVAARAGVRVVATIAANVQLPAPRTLSVRVQEERLVVGAYRPVVSEAQPELDPDLSRPSRQADVVIRHVLATVAAQMRGHELAGRSVGQCARLERDRAVAAERSSTPHLLRRVESVPVP